MINPAKESTFHLEVGNESSSHTYKSGDPDMESELTFTVETQGGAGVQCTDTLYVKGRSIVYLWTVDPTHTPIKEYREIDIAETQLGEWDRESECQPYA